MEGEQGSLNGRREVIRGELRRNVMGQLKDQIYLEDEQLYEQIDTAIRQKGKETYLPLKERLWLRNSLYDSFRRLDILQELLDDKDVTEIMINGAGKIFIEKKGNMVLWNRRFEKTEQLEDIIQQIVGKGSLTVEASCVMAVVLFSLAALIGKAGQIHDETAAAMVLHEGVEKCRHEKSIRSEDAEAFCKRNAGLMLRYTDLSVSIQEKGAKKMGKVKGGDWEKQIEMKEFRPEEFMRMVTGITGGTNEN